MKIAKLIVLFGLLAVLIGAAAISVAPAAEEPKRAHSIPNIKVVTDVEAVTALLKRFDEVQLNTQTMIANFVEKKKLQLLADDQIQTGTFYYSKPSSFMWEYSKPDDKVILISAEQLLIYYPQLKKAEEIDITRYSKRILRFFGLGQPTTELRKYYDLTLAEDPAMPDTYLLILDPRKRRVQKRLDSIRIWIDREMLVPRQVEYVETDGDSTRFTFRNLEINSAISPAKYVIKIPPDVEVSNSFSGFTGVQQGY
ncbi:MAG: outer membrane lipoprotein carrier protein LolA [Acidobacteriota bacterium]